MQYGMSEMERTKSIDPLSKWALWCIKYWINFLGGWGRWGGGWQYIGYSAIIYNQLMRIFLVFLYICMLRWLINWNAYAGTKTWFPISQTGCVYDGRVLRNGQAFSYDTCTMCRCEDGDVSCDQIECGRLSCDNQINPEGSCCPRCRDGCEYEGMSFNNGMFFTPMSNPCLQCSCRVSRRWIKTFVLVTYEMCTGMSLPWWHALILPV